MNEDLGMTVQFVGGEKDGCLFKQVRNNETGKVMWISETYPGVNFKQVFVPQDFTHPSIIEL